MNPREAAFFPVFKGVTAAEDFRSAAGSKDRKDRSSLNQRLVLDHMLVPKDNERGSSLFSV